MVIGSGPILIGQAAEFDYSGTQACRVLKAEGLRVSLVNSNPATIMTDPEVADATYVEPLTPEYVERVIAKERPDALLATLGGQTALNIAIGLHENGVLEKYGVQLIGADVDAINRGEDRQIFKDIVRSIGADAPRSTVCGTVEEALATAEEVGYPVVIRPSFTMGGLGSGIATDEAMLRRMAGHGLADSPVHTVLIEESVLGWKEYELELMRDRSDNVVVVCSIENVDPMGVHTGDSVTVAPAMTLTDREYQAMRDLGIAVLREVGVDTGGCNIQFAVHPHTGRMVVIEMNPRVSRSSALALDYVVVKVPRFAFEKFPTADRELTTHMKSVGEAMAIGRSFTEALGKAMRSTETGRAGWWTGPDPDVGPGDRDRLVAELATPVDGRLYTIERALRAGATVAAVAGASGIDPWFVEQIATARQVGADVADAPVLTPQLLRRAKRFGLSDRQIAALRPELAGEDGVRTLRLRSGIRPVFKTVDTCAAEFAAATPYHYSTYDEETEVAPQPERPKVIILGSGPNRIGQGIEFDYSCVHAAQSLRQAGYETVMVNCNPETVSTDYDTSDRLYVEPLTLEDVLEVVHAEQESGTVAGVICTLGGQTPLGLAQRLKDAGVPILGTQPEAIHLAEDREEFSAVLTGAGLPAPRHGTASSFAEARAVAAEIGYPVLVRPSYVLGGRGMEIVYDEAALQSYLTRHLAEIGGSDRTEHPILVDRFLDDAVELDVDALYDGEQLYLGGVMEHIEEAGIHSGDSACALPPITLGATDVAAVRQATGELAARIGVRGLINVQYALKDGMLSVLEANPRASRTVPFVSKATAVPLAKAAARIALGATVEQLRKEGLLPATGDGGDLPADAPVAVKEAVLPCPRFRRTDGSGVDTVLGPEMRSTGEVMGLDAAFGTAFAKSQAAAYGSLPTGGTAFVSIANRDKRAAILPIMRLADLGFRILATEGTALALRRHGVPVEVVARYRKGTPEQPDCVQRIQDGEVALVFNTPWGSPGNSGPRLDGYEIRTAAVAAAIPCVTTVQGMTACVQGVEALLRGDIGVRSLQELHAQLREGDR